MSQNKVFDRYIKTEKGKVAVSKAVNKYVKTERGKAVTASSRAKNAVKVTFELRKSTDKDILSYFPDTNRPAFVRSSIRIAHAIQADLEAIAKTWRAEANALAPQEDTNRYNNQNIEIDANSFAIAMHLMTQKPDARRVDAFIEYLFYNQNETIRDKIFDNTMAFLGLE